MRASARKAALVARKDGSRQQVAGGSTSSSGKS